MVHQAEIMYDEVLEVGFRLCTDSADCSDQLPLDLASGAGAYWDVRVGNHASGFCVEANNTAINMPARSYHMTAADTEPQDCNCGGGSCSPF